MASDPESGAVEKIEIASLTESEYIRLLNATSDERTRARLKWEWKRRHANASRMQCGPAE